MLSYKCLRTLLNHRQALSVISHTLKSFVFVNMISCKWLIQQTRNCANWNVAQRQIQKKQGLVSPQIFEEYQRSLPKIVDKGLTNVRFNPELCDRLKRITEYNTESGKQIRGLLTVSSCQALLKPEREQELREKIFALGWAVEMFHAFFLITDDMEDGAKTRRGKTCWHLLPDVGAYAINDVGLFRTFISEIIKQYFGKDDVYPKIINVFNEAYFKTHIGQFIDTTLCKSRNYLNLTKETYITTVKYKTAGYSFEFPVLLGLAVSNKESEKAFKLVESVCTDVGLLLQMQNDFLDFYDDESVGGKSGTDIQEGKCSWLALTALKHCNNTQQQIFLNNYGRWEPERVDEIRKLYNELQLFKICKNEEKQLYESLVNRINNLTKESVPPGDLFAKLVNMVYTIGNINYEEKTSFK